MVSSHLVSCAASRIVKGRTRTVTEIEDEALAMAAVYARLVSTINGQRDTSTKVTGNVFVAVECVARMR